MPQVVELIHITLFEEDENKDSGGNDKNETEEEEEQEQEQEQEQDQDQDQNQDQEEQKQEQGKEQEKKHQFGAKALCTMCHTVVPGRLPIHHVNTACLQISDLPRTSMGLLSHLLLKKLSHHPVDEGFSERDRICRDHEPPIRVMPAAQGTQKNIRCTILDPSSSFELIITIGDNPSTTAVRLGCEFPARRLPTIFFYPDGSTGYARTFRSHAKKLNNSTQFANRYPFPHSLTFEKMHRAYLLRLSLTDESLSFPPSLVMASKKAGMVGRISTPFTETLFRVRRVA